MITIADRLYAVLATMPCSCTMKWIDGKHIITRTCSRCRVMEEYRNEVKELEAQTMQNLPQVGELPTEAEN